MNELGDLITTEIFTLIKLFVTVVSLVHLLVALILFQQVMGMNKMISAPHSGLIRAVGIVHLLVLTGILLLVIFY